MAISKKSVSNKQNLKLSTLKNDFHRSLNTLTQYAIQQENRLHKSLDSLKVKLKKAVAQQKLIKKPKKNLTPAIEKQIMKAQIAVDTLELEIALTTDNLNLMTTQVDHFLEVTALYEAKPAKKAKTPVKAKTKIKAEVAPVAPKANVKAPSKLKAKAKAKPKSKNKIESIPEVEHFDLSEIFTPEMDLGFLSETDKSDPMKA